MRRHRFASGLVLFLVLLTPSLSAEPAAAARWEPLPLWGGRVQVVAAQGDSPVVYAASPTAGLYQSLDRGATWRFVAHGPDGIPLLILGVDPHDPRRLFALNGDVSNYLGLFRSDDGGKHWERSDRGLPQYVNSLAFDPERPGLIYAATSTGLYRSRNGGTGWLRIAFPRRILRQVAVAPGDPRIVFVSVARVGTWRSSDGGETFVQVLDQDLGQMVFDPAEPGRVYALDTGTLFYRSDDLGVTWTRLPESRYAWQELAITRAGTLLAASLFQGVAWSVDGGTTWEPAPNQTRPRDRISSFAVLGDEVLAGGSQGVWRSMSEGWRWEASSTGIRGRTTALEVAADADSTLWVIGGGIFTSRDEGASFQSHRGGLGPNGGIGRPALHPRRPQFAYAFGCCVDGEGGLLKTEDGGLSWEVVPYTGVDREVEVLVVDPKNPDVVYAGGLLEPHGSPCTAVRSTDGGATWTCVGPSAQARFTELVIDPRDPRILYGLFDEELYRSADRGDTWELVRSRVFGRSFVRLFIDPARRDRLFATLSGRTGIVRSDDGGRTWRPASDGLPEGSLTTDLLLDPSRPGRVWIAVAVPASGEAGRATSRVFRSDDAGRHWTEVSAGLPRGILVTDLAADPRAADVLYAGTAGRGLYRLRVEE